MKKTRILSIVLAMLTIFSLMSVTTFTINAEPVPVGDVIVSTVKGRTGSTVDVTVSIANNPGIVMMMLKLSYDNDVLKLIGISNTNSVFTDAMHGGNLNLIPFNMSWLMIMGAGTDNVNNGLLATLTFEILSDAEIGDTPVTITYDPRDVLNASYKQVAFDIQNGSVEVVIKKAGDVNDNGRVEAVDSILVCQYLLGGYHMDEISLINADADDNNRIDSTDALIIRQYVLKGYGVDMAPDETKLNV